MRYATLAVILLVGLAGCSTSPDRELINTMSANGCQLESFSRSRDRVSVTCFGGHRSDDVKVVSEHKP